MVISKVMFIICTISIILNFILMWIEMNFIKNITIPSYILNILFAVLAFSILTNVIAKRVIKKNNYSKDN